METDFLVIGSGIAGLTFALDVAKYGKTIIITKKESSEANTNYAQGGIAAAIYPPDNIKAHIEDTIKVGDGLCNYDAVELIANEAPNVIQELFNLGVGFEKSDNKKFDLGQEGGHSFRRIIHTKDATGKEIEATLIKKVKELGISILENFFAVDLIIENNKCFGAQVIDINKGEIIQIFAKFTLIASGGIGAVYLHTTNPAIATGDGIAMAYRAGAKIANMEFVQFHPTSFYGKKIGTRSLLLTEALRGEGGILTINGKRFMHKYDERGELAPRDIVARAIHFEMKNTGAEYVLLDVTGIGENRIKDRFPNIYEACLKLGIDITKEPIPVVPAAHYICGGILVNLDGKTTIKNLYSAGECSCTGVHGANRLASNSLLESVVFAHRAAKSAIKEINEYRLFHRETLRFVQNETQVSRNDKLYKKDVSEYLYKIRKVMNDYVGIVRKTSELILAKRELLKLKNEFEKIYANYKITVPIAELRNMITTALLIVECAIIRKESRGLHYNLDYPKKDDLNYKKDTIIERRLIEKIYEFESR